MAGLNGRFDYELSNYRATILKPARPETLAGIETDSTLRYMLRNYQQRAWVVGSVLRLLRNAL